MIHFEEGRHKHEEKDMLDSTRRAFVLCTLGSAACALAASCGSKSGAPAPFGDVSAGNVKDLPVGTLQRVGSEPVFIARDAGGLYALTSTCTHAGCEVEAQGSGASAALLCPCHGSQFDRSGAVTRGPAGSPLVHFAVEVDSAGNVTIHGAIQVDAP